MTRSSTQETGPKPSTDHADNPGMEVGGNGEEGRLRPLVIASVLPSGTPLMLARRGDVVLRGIVDGSGWIVIDGVAYRSPSDKAFARALGRQSLNGWTKWRAQLTDGAVLLDVL